MLVRVIGSQYSLIVFQRKFRVYRNNFFFDKHHCVHNRPVGKWILHLIAFGRQNVFEHGLQIILAQDTTLFGIAQNILQIFELVGKPHHLLIRLFESGELLGNIFDNPHRLTRLRLEHTGRLPHPRIQSTYNLIHLVLEYHQTRAVTGRTSLTGDKPKKRGKYRDHNDKDNNEQYLHKLLGLQPAADKKPFAQFDCKYVDYTKEHQKRESQRRYGDEPQERTYRRYRKG